MAEKYAKRYHVGLGNVGSYQVSAKPLSRHLYRCLFLGLQVTN